MSEENSSLKHHMVLLEQPVRGQQHIQRTIKSGRLLCLLRDALMQQSTKLKLEKRRLKRKLLNRTKLKLNREKRKPDRVSRPIPKLSKKELAKDIIRYQV